MEELPKRTPADIEKMIQILDQEIVNAGDKIDPKKLSLLTNKIQVLLEERAKLTGESVNRKAPWRGDAE